MPRLKKLSINQNKFQAEGAAELARYFKTYKSLEWLDISSNDMMGGFAPILESITESAQTGKLKYLNISNNCAMDSQDARAIS